jgi:micrococcal nuclease
MTVLTIQRLVLALLASLVLVCDAVAYQITAKVIRVADGDTITVREGQTNHRIRLASIDAPEKGSGSNRPGQAYANAATKYLASLVAGKTVVLDCFEADRYGRHVCDVLLDSVTANQLMVFGGMAWANRQAEDKYLRDRTLLQLQAQAQADQRGLWAQPNPIAPWDWRVNCWRQGQCQQ